MLNKRAVLSKAKRYGTRIIGIWLCITISILFLVFDVSNDSKQRWDKSSETSESHLKLNRTKLGNKINVKTNKVIEIKKHNSNIIGASNDNPWSNLRENINNLENEIKNNFWNFKVPDHIDSKNYLFAYQDTTESVLNVQNFTREQQITISNDGLNAINTDSTTILDLPKLPFLPSYRNPCWLEPLPSSYPYVDNRYGGKTKGYLSHLTPRWTALYDQQRATGKTHRLRCLPYFYIGGLPKCGTTDMYDMLMQHPQITGSLFKEPHYWTRWRFWTDKCFWKEYMCADGQACISQDSVCNGRRNCPDGSDEIDCGGPWHCSSMNGGCTHTCTMTQSGPKCTCPRNFQLKRDRKTCTGGVPFTDYIDLFDAAANFIEEKTALNDFHPVVTGEATPATFWDNHRWHNEPSNDNQTTEPRVVTADLITHVTPNVKMIAMVRNPTKRLYSDLLYFKPYGTPEMFHNKVVEGITWLNECFKRKSIRACVHEPMDSERPPEGRYWVPVERIRIGIYSEYVKDWLRVIPRSNLKVIRLEDYSVNRTQVLSDTVKFLELDEMPIFLKRKWETNSVRNTGSKKYERQGEMRNETKTLLDQFYKPFNNELASLLNNQNFSYS